MRREMAHRVRIEGGDHRRPAGLPRPADRLGSDALVAHVKAVEIAERHDGAEQGVRNQVPVLDADQPGSSAGASSSRR